MESALHSTLITLKDWEDYLAPQVRTVELLGEIPITASECAQLGQAIARHVKRWGHAKALRSLERDYPCTLAVYLVAQGIHGYKGGDYWTPVVRATGLSSGYTSQVGRAFEEIIDHLHLPMFPDLHGHRYVSLILVHGGIPDYCLDDFFANMLQPAVTKARYAGTSAPELIDEWLYHASGRYFTDKPVLHFLEFGDRVASDFCERCLEMARGYLDTGQVPGAQDVGLPERVVRAYVEWIAQQGADQVQRETADRWRLRKPEIRVDPWGEGVILDLPAQQVPATMVYADPVWKVTAQKTRTVRVHIHRTGFDWRTTAESLPLSEPAETYEVSFAVDGETMRTWRYQGPSKDCPLLVFDEERGTLLTFQHTLPARRLGVIYPRQVDLQVQGDAHLVEDLPRMPWGWAAYRGQVWDWRPNARLTLSENGHPVLNLVFRPDEAAQRPHLVGSERLMPQSPDNRSPVYVGLPPGIRIPLTGRGTQKEELARWRLFISHRWPVTPSLQVQETLIDLQPDLVPGDGFVDLPLALPSLLGPSPMGSYTVRLRGPLGRDAEFVLRIIPHLVLCGHETLYLPDAKRGPAAASLLIETAAGDGIECQGYSAPGTQGAACQVQIAERESRGWEYEVEAGPDVTHVEVAVIRTLAYGDSVRVPVQVPIRRLRWALIDEQSVFLRREWTGHTFRRPIEALAQTQHPALLISLPIEDASQIEMSLRLLDVERAELMAQEVVRPGRGHQVWRAELAAFLDTIQASRSPVLRFELEVENLLGQKPAVQLSVLSLTQALIVDDVSLSPRRVNSGVVLDLKWREAAPLRNRHVRLWPLWRPWDPVFEHNIPDEARGELTFPVDPRALQSGKYRLEFLVVDPWILAPEASRPARSAPGATDVELIDPDRQLQVLEQRLRRQGASFELLLQQAIVCQDVGDLQTATTHIQWCFEHLEDATVPQITALVEAMQDSGDRATLHALQLKLSAASRVQRLLTAYREGDISAEHVEQYLANLPRSGLLPEATCELLLTVDDERARLHAAQQLIRRSNTSGPEAVLRWVQNAQMSDADAIAVLKINANSSGGYLDQHLDDAVALRLYEALAQEQGDRTSVIRPGMWVRTDAGWGRIERIKSLAGETVEQYVRGQDQFQLSVTLRPNSDAEPIVVDMDRKRISFPQAERIYTCSKCNRFSTQHWHLIVNEHNRVAHDGTGPAYRPERVTVRSLRTVEYSARKPKNELA